MKEKSLRGFSNYTVFDSDVLANRSRSRAGAEKGRAFIENRVPTKQPNSDTNIANDNYCNAHYDLDDLMKDFSDLKEIDEFSDLHVAGIEAFMDEEENELTCESVDTETAVADAVRCVLESDRDNTDTESIEEDTNDAAPEKASMPRFLDLAETTVREGELLLRCEHCELDSSRMSDLLQQLSVEISEFHMAARKNARQSRITDFC